MATSTTAVAQVSTARPRRRRRWIKYGAILIIVLLIWAAFDLYAPRRTLLHRSWRSLHAAVNPEK